MAQVQEGYTPKVIAANGNTGNMSCRGIGGFAATVTGTLTITDGGVTIVNAIPVTAGVYLPLPFATTGVVVATCAGGAAGTLGVW